MNARRISVRPVAEWRAPPRSILRIKLSALMLLAFIPSFGVLASLTLQSVEPLETAAQEDAAYASSLMAREKSGLLGSALERLRFAAAFYAASGADAEACRVVLENAVLSSSRYSGAALLAVDGRTVCSFPGRATGFAERRWFREALVAAGPVATTEALAGSAVPEIAVAQRVFDGDAALVLALIVDTAAFTAIDGSQLFDGASANVISRSGLILSRLPEPEKYVGTQGVPAEMMPELLAGPIAAISTGVDGEERAYGSHPIVLNGEPVMLAIVGLPLQRTIQTVLTRNLALLGISAVAAVLLIWVGSDRILVAPLRRVSNVARQLRSSGELSLADLPVDRHDEIGEAAREVRAMALAVRERQRLLETVERVARIGSWHFDHARGRFDVSGQFLQILGTTRNDHLLRFEDFLKCLPPEEQPRLIDLAARAEAGQHAEGVETLLLRRDGTTRKVVIKAAADVHGDEEIGLWPVSGTLEDISELAELREQYAASQRLEAIGRLTGGIAHDFNNLLTIIIGNADLLAEDLVDSPRQLRLVTTSLAAAERAAELTSRMLAFARRQPLAPRPVDLAELVRGLDPLLTRALGEDIHYRLAVSTEASPVAIVDRVQMESALLNLCINARDAMPNGGVITLDIASRSFDAEEAAREDVDPGEYVVLSVTDTGTGMPPEILARAFEPFFTTKPPGTGSGLGLSMVFGYVKQLGGHVKIYSEVGHGTTVSLYLPRAAGGDPEDEIRQPPEAAGGKERILLVEDDALVREHAERMLLSLGYVVVTVPDGETAIDMLSRASFDLLLTDVVLPGPMAGPDVARHAVRIYPDLKILFTSGYPKTVMIGQQGRLSPEALLLQKPYRKRDLARLVREALSRESGLPYL